MSVHAKLPYTKQIRVNLFHVEFLGQNKVDLSKFTRRCLNKYAEEVYGEIRHHHQIAHWLKDIKQKKGIKPIVAEIEKCNSEYMLDEFLEDVTEFLKHEKIRIDEFRIYEKYNVYATLNSEQGLLIENKDASASGSDHKISKIIWFRDLIPLILEKMLHDKYLRNKYIDIKSYITKWRYVFYLMEGSD